LADVLRPRLIFGAGRSGSAARANRKRRPKVSTLTSLRRTGLIAAGVTALVGLSLGLVIGYQALAESQTFRLTRLSLTGSEQLQRAEILKMAGIEPGMSLLKLDAEAVRQRLMASPWVSQARVRRVLPDELRIDLIERRPVAVVMASKPAYLGAEGRIFKKVEPGENLDLPVISGLSNEALKLAAGREDLRRARDVLARLAGARTPLPLERLSEIEINQRLGLVLLPLDKGPRIILGRGGDVGIRFEHWRRVKSDLKAKGLWEKVSYIDLRLDDRAYIGLMPG